MSAIGKETRPEERNLPHERQEREGEMDYDKFINDAERKRKRAKKKVRRFPRPQKPPKELRADYLKARKNLMEGP